MFSLVLLNGGVGSRIGGGQPKQFLAVAGVPIIAYSLRAAAAVDEIDDIVLNYPDGWRAEVEKIVADCAVRKPVSYHPAGATRHESVRLLLPHCRHEHIVLHETARPLIDADDIRTIVAAPHDNVSFMLEIPFTVAPVDPEHRKVTGSLDRAKLRNVQLPQKYRRADLIAAHEYAEREGLVFTEDGTLVTVAGFEMFYVDGTERNIKVTTPTDVQLAEFLLGS
ncbi:MAG: IspD/TarI family cytidylyltransferase [Micromonosporaceae bacterium]